MWLEVVVHSVQQAVFLPKWSPNEKKTWLFFRYDWVKGRMSHLNRHPACRHNRNFLPSPWRRNVSILLFLKLIEYRLTVHFFPRFVSSLNSWKVVSWLDTPSENSCLKQVKVGFWIFISMSKFLSHFLIIWDQKLNKIQPGTLKKLVFWVFFFLFFLHFPKLF